MQRKKKGFSILFPMLYILPFLFLLGGCTVFARFADYSNDEFTEDCVLIIIKDKYIKKEWTVEDFREVELLSVRGLTSSSVEKYLANPSSDPDPLQVLRLDLKNPGREEVLIAIKKLYNNER